MAGPELARGVGSRCVVPAGLGALLELLFAGPQATTVHDRVASSNVLRVTPNPNPRRPPSHYSQALTAYGQPMLELCE